MRIDIKGDIIQNDDKWIYEWLEMDGTCPKDVLKSIEEANGDRLDVYINSGGGDISETTAVYNGTVDFGVTWVSNLINANAGGMDLLEVAQVYQRSGLVLVYKKK